MAGEDNKDNIVHQIKGFLVILLEVFSVERIQGLIENRSAKSLCRAECQKEYRWKIFVAHANTFFTFIMTVPRILNLKMLGVFKSYAKRWTERQVGQNAARSSINRTSLHTRWHRKSFNSLFLQCSCIISGQHCEMLSVTRRRRTKMTTSSDEKTSNISSEPNIHTTYLHELFNRNHLCTFTM